MPFTGAMRAWALGQVVLVIDVATAAGLGLARRSPGSGTTAPLVVLAGALVFFVPFVLALALPSIRTRAAFWAASVVPALLWIPAIPAVFLRGGPALATPAGLALAGVAIVGAVLVTTGGVLAAIEAAAAGPADTSGATSAEVSPSPEPAVEAPDAPQAAVGPVDATGEARRRRRGDLGARGGRGGRKAPGAAAPKDGTGAIDAIEEPQVAATADALEEPQVAQGDPRSADDELVAELVRQADDGSTPPDQPSGAGGADRAADGGAEAEEA